MTTYKFKELILNRNQGINTTTEHIKYSKQGITVLRAKNIGDNSFILDDLVYINENDYSLINSNFKIEPNDVLYTNIGSQFGNACIVTDSTPMLITWNIMKIQVNKEIILPKYMQYLLSTQKNRERIRNLNSSSTMPFVSGTVLDNVEFQIDEINEQKHIVDTITKEVSYA